MDKSIASEPYYQSPDARNDLGMGRTADTVFLDYTPYMARKILDKLGRSALIINHLDYYANTIPLGAFCNAIAFILYGWYRCRIIERCESFLWTVVFIFGAVGQLVAGFLEFIKGRTFPSTLYLTLGAYCLSHYALFIIPRRFSYYDGNDQLLKFDYYYSSGTTLCCYYSGLCFLAFALLIFSFRTNVLYILQCALTLAFFIVRAIGEGESSLGTKRNAAGILESIAGFFSLFVGISQLVNNETVHKPVFPVGAMAPDNEIDIDNFSPVSGYPMGMGGVPMNAPGAMPGVNPMPGAGIMP